MGSVFFHVSAIGLVISLFTPVEFQVYEKVADVVIVSPGRLRIPSIDRRIALGEDISIPESLSRAEKKPEETGEAESIAERESVVPSGRTIRRGRMPQDKIAILPPELTAKFRLDASQSEKPGFTLNINPADASETAREMTTDELDLLSYLPSNPTQTLPLRGHPSRKIRAGVSPPGRTGEENVVVYDITPWAESAVAHIQRNWAIPSAQGEKDKKAVEISVVISKSGELLSYEIRNSSGMPHLDIAALNSIQLSSPLPALPADFPLDLLEADLLFQYYE